MTTMGEAHQVGSAANGRLAWLRARRDQLMVFVVLVAIWQLLSMKGIGPGVYLVGSPWGVLQRFVTGVFLGGDLLVHMSYTFSEALAGFLLGAIPAVLLPFLLRRRPMAVAIIDPVMVGGYGAPKLALAPLFVLW